MSGKRKKRRDVSASLSSINLREELPTIEAWIDEKKRIALLDSECSLSLVIGFVCSPWSRHELNIMTANGEIIHGRGVGTIMVAVNNLNPIRADVLVMDSQLLSSDMLLGMDVIKILGGVSIDQSGEAIFNRTDPPACIVISIEESDFNAEFNKQTCVWSGDHPPNELANKVPEYSVSVGVFSVQKRMASANSERLLTKT